MTDRFCADCKHYRVGGPRAGLGHCLRVVAGVDPVSGDTVHAARACRRERHVSLSDVVAQVSRCGQEGRFWEAREHAGPPHEGSSRVFAR